MKKLILILLLAPAFAQAQLFKSKKAPEPVEYHIVNPEFVKVGLQKQAFAEWAKSVDEWSKAQLNQSISEGYDQTYFIRNREHQKWTTYVYLFRGDEIAQVQITPYSFDNYHDDLLKEGHSFTGKEQVSDTETRYTYVNEDLKYFIEVIETHQEGEWENKHGFKMVAKAY